MLMLAFTLLVASFVIGLTAWSGSGRSFLPRAASFTALVLGILVLIASGFAQVEAGRVGVASLFGAVDAEPLTQGLHLISPLKNVTKMSTRTEAISVHAGPGGRPAGDTVDAISADGMRMPLDATVYYRLLPADAPWVYQHLGEDFADKIVVPATRTAVREALARFTAQEAYSTKRDQLTQLMQDILRRHVRALLDDYKFDGQAVVVQQVLLRNIGIPDQVRDAIEKKLAAEQQALAMQFVLQKETQEAERKRIEARGIADFQKIVTEGISDKLLAWKGIEATLEISKSPNAKVVVIGNSKNGLPVIFDSSASGGAPR